MAPQISQAKPANPDECEICGEVITQPVCAECLGYEMMEWMIGRKEHKADLMNYIKDSARLFNAYGEKDVKCIVCGDNMRVCAHCYCNEVYDYVTCRHPELIEEFLTHFDFNLHFKISMLQKRMVPI